MVGLAKLLAMRKLERMPKPKRLLGEKKSMLLFSASFSGVPKIRLEKVLLLLSLSASG